MKFNMIIFFLIFTVYVRGQTVGDSFMLMFEADNSQGFDTFTNAREYPVINTTLMMSFGGVSGIFTANNVHNLAIVDSTPSGGFPFEDNFQDAGGLWTVNDPNFDVNDGLGEQLTVEFLFSSDSETNDILSTNILSVLSGTSYFNGDFQENPAFPIDDPLIRIGYNPPMESPEFLIIMFDQLLITDGSTPDQYKLGISGTVISNEITSLGTSLSVPEPSTTAMVYLFLMGSIFRRSRKC